MANLQAGEGSSSRDVSADSSESTLQLNVKTLDSRIFSFQIDKKITISAFKEKIASQVGIPVQQQRLIFRGKVLKDDHLLSEYNAEDGDTLHVVERQAQPSPGPNTVPFAAGQDSAFGVPRHRIGHISHSIVLGSLNVGEPGEAAGPDLNRVIGAVLNSVGLGNLPGGVQPGVPASQGNGTDSRSNAGSQNQAGNQPNPLQGVHGQSASPMGAAFAIPTLNTPIPDALTTITEFINQMELVLSQNGNRQSQPPTASSNSPIPELHRNSRGYPTVEALNTVLQRAQHLLRDTAVPALSSTASRLVQDRSSSDPSVREQVHAESMRLGVAMQHLGALFLELGRTILNLHLGQSPDESFVYAGPAVYISPSGPNPIMVQPFPLQNSSLFGASTGVASSPMAMGAVGVGSGPRNVNIHIHTGASLSPLIPTAGNRAFNGENARGEQVNGTDSGESGQSRLPSRNNIPSSTVPLSNVAVIGDQQEKTETSTSSQGGSHNVLAGSSHSNDNAEVSSGVPLGLGLGGLQPKKRSKQAKTQEKSNEDKNSVAVGQQVLQSLASLSTRGNTNPPSSQETTDLSRGGIGSAPETRQNDDEPGDVVDAMSQVLGSPSLDGLLAGVSQQTGIGSPDMLRNMFQQFTQNPTMRNTINQMAQQMDGQNLGSMLSGLDNRGEGGGIDLAGMMQQMMPIVSQAFGGMPSLSQRNPPSESVPFDNSSRRDVPPINDDPQVDLQPVLQSLEDQTSPQEIFRSVAERALHLSNGGNEVERILDELCSQGGLAQEFMEMLGRDISRRLQG